MNNRRINVLLALCLSPLATLAQSPMQRFQREDADGDGRVTRAEFKGPDQNFNRLDRNRDGAITRDELPGRRQGPARVPETIELIRDVEFGTGNGESLKLDLLRPKADSKEPRPVVVFVHGGGWKSGDKAGGIQRLAPLAEKGYFCATINYRLTGMAGFPAQIEDCKCAIRYLRAHAEKYNLDPERIGVWGSSAGGHLVALLGTAGDAKDLEGAGGWEKQSSRVQAVCDWFGPSDFLSMAKQRSNMNHSRSDSPEGLLLRGKVDEVKERAIQASPTNYVSEDDPPFLIMHGAKDNTVPLEQSRILESKLKEAGVPVELVVFENAGHGGREFSDPETTKKVVAFFDGVLRK